MKRFAGLLEILDKTSSTNGKIEALSSYFLDVSEEDRLWAIALLSQRRPRRMVNVTLLRTWAAEASELPLWLFEESYHIVGDLAETIALLLPKPVQSSDHTLSYWIRILLGLSSQDENQKKQQILAAWRELNSNERFLFNKILTGGFRIGVSSKLVVKALSRVSGIDENLLIHKLMGNWSPQEITYQELIQSSGGDEEHSKPYPFYLAYALDQTPETIGDPGIWQAEFKWDGIRAQLISRNNQIYIWSRGEELISTQFPELTALTSIPDGTVIDGEILAFRDGMPLGFQMLQSRINRRSVTRKLVMDIPIVLMCYDLLETGRVDIRDWPLHSRRKPLRELVNDLGYPLLYSEEVSFQTWEELITIRQTSREKQAEGLMLKKLESTYKVGRRRGDWWKWKLDPFSIDAVLLYAQQGHGRRANLFTDYTFAVWKGAELIPFTKAYSGLTDEEFEEITRYVKQNTLERFGPVRAVVPNLVFEIAFEGIQKSSRHKSGIALRFPRMIRWRKDKHPSEANTLDDLNGLLQQYGANP